MAYARLPFGTWQDLPRRSEYIAEIRDLVEAVEGLARESWNAGIMTKRLCVHKEGDNV
jgi:hypothetical protein